MDDLLADVIEAHGGLDRWQSVALGEATIVTGGGLWGIKGLIQDPNPRRMTVSLHEERASVKPSGDPDWQEWSGRAPAPLAGKLRGAEPRKEHVPCHGLLPLLRSPPSASIWARTAKPKSPCRMSIPM
jgi:hypothetical protein